MHDLSKEIIEKRINKLIEEWDFERRKESNSEECICYKQDKKCHNIEDLNCLFCFCPYYNTQLAEGKCNITSPMARYIDNHDGKILDCGDCDLMHRKENIKRYLINRLYNI